MIRIENIKKSFSSGDIKTMALNGVSMEVQKGEFVAVMGPSGCGKTTLLNILGLLDRPDEGRYFLDGTDTSSLVLADEPTGNLDSANGTQVMELLKTVQQEFSTTIIMVTHNQRDALYADKTLNLLDGSVIDKKTLL